MSERRAYVRGLTHAWLYASAITLTLLAPWPAWPFGLAATVCFALGILRNLFGDGAP